MATKKPVQKAEPSTSEIGATGLRQFNGQVDEEMNPKLRSPEARRRIFTEMSENDPVVGAILTAMDLLLRQVPWVVHPKDAKNEQAMKNAAFIDECKEDMSHSWLDFLSAALSVVVFGWSFHEIVYGRRLGGDFEDPAATRSQFDDGKWKWQKLAPRAQDTLVRWKFDDNGGIQGMYQSALPTLEEKYIPIEKAVLIRTSTMKNNPEGRSMLRNAYRPWYFKRRIEEIEAIGIERDLAGIPVAWVPTSYLAPGATGDELAALNEIKKIVRNIRRDEQESIVWPLAYDENGNKRFDLTLLSTGGRRQFDVDGVIARLDQRIAMVALADFILLGHEKIGSFALGSSKVDLFTSALSAVLEMIADSVNRHAVPRLLKLNGEDPRLAPKILPGKISAQDLGELGDYIAKIAGAGAPLFPDDELESHLRMVANLPDVPEDRDEQRKEEAEEKAEAEVAGIKTKEDAGFGPSTMGGAAKPGAPGEKPGAAPAPEGGRNPARTGPKPGQAVVRKRRGPDWELIGAAEGQTYLLKVAPGTVRVLDMKKRALFPEEPMREALVHGVWKDPPKGVDLQKMLTGVRRLRKSETFNVEDEDDDE